MKTSKRALQFIKDHEGLRLKAYKDAVGIWTIGYGHTSDAYFNVEKGMEITNAKANDLLRHDVEEAEAGIDNMLKEPLPNGNMYGAVVSLVFNIGLGAFRNSTLLKKLNKKDYNGAASEFSKWVKAGGKTLPGLVRRRAEEKALFMTPVDLENTNVGAKTDIVSKQTAAVRKVAKGDVSAAKKGWFSGTFKKALTGTAATFYGADYFGWWNQVKDYVGDYAPWIIGGLAAAFFIGWAAKNLLRTD